MNKILFMLVVAFTVSACTPKTLFTHQARLRLEKEEIDLRKIQFYNDKEIVLQRKVESHEVNVTSGKIRMEDGRRIQEIKIRRNTPAIVEDNSGDKLIVRFEPGEGKTLQFYKNSYDKYQIDAEQWVKRNGKVTYDGKTFYIKPSGNDALLLVRKSQVSKGSMESRTARGVKIK